MSSTSQPASRLPARAIQSAKRHLEVLETTGEATRNAAAEVARLEIERARSESKRDAERIRLTTDGEINALQDQLVSQSSQMQAQVDTRRRDLEGLTKRWICCKRSAIAN